MPEDNPNRVKSLELLYNLYAILRARQEQQQDIESDERILIMKLESLYQQQIRQAKEEERRITIETLLLTRFSSIDEQLSSVIQPLSQLSPNEFLPLLLQLSREELLARFHN